jgi:hypothetical protein
MNCTNQVEFESDHTPNGTTEFFLQTSVGEFVLETGRTKFSAFFKPKQGETQYFEGTMAGGVASGELSAREREKEAVNFLNCAPGPTSRFPTNEPAYTFAEVVRLLAAFRKTQEGE